MTTSSGIASTTMPSRDSYLDCLKGFAIVTVVLGHTFQGATADFDHYLPFRLIYSFHMPMFMFVAGMTASLSLSRRLNTDLNLPAYGAEIWSKAVRLVVPFVTWAVIQYFMVHPPGYNLQTWLLHVIQVPDNGLWFLWTLFQCSCLLAFASITVQFASRLVPAARPVGNNGGAIPYHVLVALWLIAYVTLRVLPGLPSIGLTKAHFFYFFAGLVFHSVRPAGLPNSARWAPYVIFIALAPFWYRLELSPLVQLFPRPERINSVYQTIVALAGTLAFVDLVRIYADRTAAFVQRPMAYVGERSLDIYAIHFYVLGYFPPVLAPLLISVGVSLLLRTNPLTSWLCLGQKPLNIPSMWRGQFSRGAPVHTVAAEEAVVSARSKGA